MATVLRMMTSLLSSSPRSVTKLRSILSASTGKRCSADSDEKPVPKSSRCRTDAAGADLGEHVASVLGL